MSLSFNGLRDAIDTKNIEILKDLLKPWGGPMNIVQLQLSVQEIDDLLDGHRVLFLELHGEMEYFRCARLKYKGSETRQFNVHSRTVPSTLSVLVDPTTGKEYIFENQVQYAGFELHMALRLREEQKERFREQTHHIEIHYYGPSRKGVRPMVRLATCCSWQQVKNVMQRPGVLSHKELFATELGEEAKPLIRKGELTSFARTVLAEKV